MTNPVRFGAVIKVRHTITGNALHSHDLPYVHPGTSGQQQVTCFAGADDNDWWLVKGPHWEGDPYYKDGEIVEHGDIIRLEHVLTGRNLHSNYGIPSPVTAQQEVTCYGNDGVGDLNDNWRLAIDGRGAWMDGQTVRLIHLASDAALHSHGGFSHPVWTAGQQEVTGFAGRDDNDLWSAADLRTHDARFLTQTAPATMVAGQSAPVTVTFRNTGITTWTAALGFRLGSQSPQDNLTWGNGRVELPGDVPPGEKVTFSFFITAPVGTSNATLHWAMLQEGITWFGESTKKLSIRIFKQAGQTTVPDVLGNNRANAQKLIKAAELEPDFTGYLGPQRAEVVAQSPDPGTLVDRGSKVRAYLNRDDL